jgi:hypothetical protein
MIRMSVKIPEAEFQILAKIAQALGLAVETLLQQSVDQDLTQMSIWVQRAEMLNH